VMKKRRMRNYSNNYSTTTAGHNGRMRAAELARGSVFSLVLCAKKARESGAQRKRREKAVLNGARNISTKTCFGKNGRAGIIGSILCVAIIAPVYSIPIPMVLCCIYISHIVLPVLFVLLPILTLCDPV